jgi:hypothetical protein
LMLNQNGKINERGVVELRKYLENKIWLMFGTTLCDKVCQWLATRWWFSPGPPSIKLTAMK